MANSPRHKATLDALSAAIAYVEKLPELDFSSREAIERSSIDAENDALSNDAPLPVRRMLTAFVRTTLNSVIRVRAVLLERQKEERARQEKMERRRKRVVARRHVVGFVASLFLATYAVCMKNQAYYEAIACVGCLAATLGLNGILYKAFERGGKE